MRKLCEIFPSVVLSVRNASAYFADYIARLSTLLEENFDHYEVIIVDDASTDETAAIIEAAQKRYPNITLFCLPKTYDQSIATIAGLDHAIGDIVITLDPNLDQPEIILDLAQEAAKGADIVYALPRDRAESRGLYNLAVKAFIKTLARLNRLDLPSAVSSARLFNRSVLNFILKAADRHRILAVAPALSGFRYATLVYDRESPAGRRGHRLARRQALAKAYNLVFAISPRPLRFVTLMTLGICGMTILYAIYAVLYWLFSEDVTPGWTSLSLQISGLFFLISLVLSVMSEYLQQILESTERRPLYFVAKRNYSDVIAYAHDLNVVTKEGDARLVGPNNAAVATPEPQTPEGATPKPSSPPELIKS